MGCAPEQSQANGRKGGRKPGSPNVRTRFRALQACREANLWPLQILRESMAYWHSRANQLETELERLELTKDNRAVAQTEALLYEAIERAQRCAVDAAPYCHPRLSAVRTKVESDVRVERIRRGDELVEAQRKYAEYLKLDPPPA